MAPSLLVVQAMDSSLRQASELRNVDNPRLLLVDDEPVLLRSLRRILQSCFSNALIESAENGEVALQRIAIQPYHVVFADLRMPTMNGLTLLAHLAAEQPRTTRIVHSSHIDTVGFDIVRRLSHKVLRKPSSALQLLDAARWGLALALAGVGAPAPSHD